MFYKDALVSLLYRLINVFNFVCRSLSGKHDSFTNKIQIQYSSYTLYVKKTSTEYNQEFYSHRAHTNRNLGQSKMPSMANFKQTMFIHVYYFPNKIYFLCYTTILFSISHIPKSLANVRLELNTQYSINPVMVSSLIARRWVRPQNQ